MFRPLVLLLIAWFFLVSVSALGFAYLSSRPDTMLWVEEVHPSNAYLRGRELKQEGHYREALAEFRRGRDYFSQIYQKTQLRTHKLQYLLGISEMADTYGKMNDADSANRAVELYRQAIELDPSYAGGQPSLAMGLILRKMKQYPAAISAFTQVLEQGSALTALQSMFERGACYFEQKNFIDASRDWYFYARYSRSVPDWIWQNMTAFPEDENPDSLYLRARAATAKGDFHSAERFWQRYQELRPGDRSAEYNLNTLTNHPFSASVEEIPLADLFPPQTGESFRLNSALMDYYAEQDGIYVLQIELSHEKQDVEMPRIRVQVQGNSKGEELIPLDSERHLELVEQNLSKGANFILLETIQNHDVLSIPWNLHAVRIERKNGA